MTFIASMRRHSQVKTPWADFPFFLHSVEFSCVNDSLTSVDFRRRLLSVKRGGCSYRYRLCTTALAGDSQGGGSPLEGGAGGIDACQAPFLGAQRAPGVGGTYPAPACPWGKRERGIKFLVAAGYFCHFISAQITDTIAPRRRCRLAVLFFAASCSVSRQPPVASLPFALGNEQSFAARCMM